MPSLGADMEDGRLLEREKAPGDTVVRGDVVAVVETRKGAPVPAPTVAIALTADHRVTDGHAGSGFLADIVRRLEDPDALFEAAP